jgi:hypothetical protein
VLFTFRKFLNHYASATLIDVLHSPFVFGLYNQCFKKNSVLTPEYFTPPSKGYFQQRSDSIIENLKAFFPAHKLTNQPSDLSKDFPVILFLEKGISYEEIEQNIVTAHNDSFVVVRNMYSNPVDAILWEHLKKLEQVTATIDLFYIGLLFVRKEQRKQYFKLRLF